jgi:hypothetical protein
VARLKKEPDPEVVLALPKNSWLLSSAVNLKLLKKQTDLLGKHIAIMTRDEKGRQFAAAQGFEVAEPDYLNRTAANIDVNKRLKRRVGPAPEPVQKPAATAKSRTAQLMPWEQQQEQTPAAETQMAEASIVETPAQQFQKIELQPEDRASLEQPGRKNKWLWRSVIAALVLFALIVVFVLPSAQITVYALTQPISRD